MSSKRGAGTAEVPETASVAQDPTGEAGASTTPRAAGDGAARHTAGMQRHRRISSLDTARGVLLLVNIAVISVVAPVPAQLKHADWFGVTFFDVIFPLFVTFSGVGLAFAYRNVMGWGRTIRRSSVLLLVGLVYNAVVHATVDVSDLRFTGPLQIYAVLVMVIGVLHLWVRTPRAWAFVTAAFALSHAYLLAAWQSGCPGGDLLPACNPSRFIDPAVLGMSHVYAQGDRGHDPEGLVATFGALVTISVGTTAGHIALKYRGSFRAPGMLLGWAMPVATLALTSSLFLPAFKRLWTTPFALGIAAAGIVFFAIGIVVMDLPSLKAWDRARDVVAWPLVALGRNSLLVYFGSHLVMHVLHGNGGQVSWAERLAARLDVLGNERAGLMLFMIACWVAVTAWLHRKKIYLRP